jgi:membrane protein implicated in regulation of membrane protease activity
VAVKRYRKRAPSGMLWAGAAMIYFYLFAFVLGGIVLVASIFLASDGGADGDGMDVTGDGVGDAGGTFGVLAGLRSLRFWTFFLAFFGLTGLVLGGFELAPPALTLALALAVGVGTASGAVAVLQWLHREQSGEAAALEDYIGRTARVIVAFSRGSTGKVRLELRGAEVDVLARTDDEQGFAAGERAVIIELEGVVAKVARLGDLDGPT